MTVATGGVGSEFHGISLVCPACRGDLVCESDDGAERLRCRGCPRSFPVVLGIPDLRLWPDPYISIEDDRAKGMLIAEECAGLGFAESVERYYSLTTKVPAYQAKRFTRSLMAAVDRTRHAMERWESGCLPPTDALLEIGCGTAPLLQAVATMGRHERLVGIDVAFRWLVLARKRLDEAGLSHVPLLCACAEALPFPDGAFDRVVADSAIETLRDQHAALDECHRVMRENAYLFFATPNRWSLGPDPHVGVPAGGLLPATWVAAWVRRRGGIPPKRTLLSHGDVRQLLRRHAFEAVELYTPEIPSAQRAGFGAGGRMLIDAYHVAVRSALGRSALLRVGPLLHGVARRGGGGGGSTPE